MIGLHMSTRFHIAEYSQTSATAIRVQPHSILTDCHTFNHRLLSNLPEIGSKLVCFADHALQTGTRVWIGPHCQVSPYPTPHSPSLLPLFLGTPAPQAYSRVPTHSVLMSDLLLSTDPRDKLRKLTARLACKALLHFPLGSFSKQFRLLLMPAVHSTLACSKHCSQTGTVNKGLCYSTLTSQGYPISKPGYSRLHSWVATISLKSNSWQDRACTVSKQPSCLSRPAAHRSKLVHNPLQVSCRYSGTGVACLLSAPDSTIRAAGWCMIAWARSETHALVVFTYLPLSHMVFIVK